MICEFYDGFYAGSGGVETRIRDLVAHLPWSFEILADRIPGHPDREVLRDGAVVRRIGPPNTVLAASPHPLNARPFLPLRLAGDLLRLRRKKRRLAEAGFELVHVHGPSLGPSLLRALNALGAVHAGIPLMDWRAVRPPRVLTVHGLWSLVDSRRTIARFERAFILSFPDVICVDAAVRDRVVAYADGVPLAPRIHLIPNGVDVGRFSVRPFRPGPRLKVGFAGRLERSRGIDILLGILASARGEFDVRVAGLGNALEVRRFRDRAAGGSYSLDTNLPSGSIPAFLEDIDVLVNPVVVPGISRVTLESMAIGRPVMMSRIGDRYPVVDGETGFLVDHDGPSYASRLRALAADRSLLESCGMRAAERVRREFRASEMCRRVGRVYDGAIRDGPA